MVAVVRPGADDPIATGRPSPCDYGENGVAEFLPVIAKNSTLVSPRVGAKYLMLFRVWDIGLRAWVKHQAPEPVGVRQMPRLGWCQTGQLAGGGGGGGGGRLKT